MGKIRKMSIQNYRNSKGLNYSTLSALQKHPSLVDTEEKEFTRGLMFGDMVDIMCFSPDDFHKNYHVSEIPLPSDKIVEIIDTIIQRDDCPQDIDTIQGDNEFNRLISIVSNSLDYGRNWKEDTVIKKVREGGEQLFRDKLNSKGKVVISPLDRAEAEQMVLCLQSHKFTSMYFGGGNKDVEILYQVPIFFDIEVKRDSTHNIKTHGKALLDILVINHNKKTLWPIDLKTIGTYTTLFPRDFIKWNYYLQAPYYSYGLRQVEEYKDYTVMNFRFIVISTKDRSRPVIYVCTDRDLEIGEYGGLSLYGDKVRGWRDLVVEYLWHVKEDKWEYPYEVYQNNGILKLDVFNFDHLK